MTEYNTYQNKSAFTGLIQIVGVVVGAGVTLAGYSEFNQYLKDVERDNNIVSSIHKRAALSKRLDEILQLDSGKFEIKVSDSKSDLELTCVYELKEGSTKRDFYNLGNPIHPSEITHNGKLINLNNKHHSYFNTRCFNNFRNENNFS
ncbi:MAG: hypothetical protein HRU03_05285 [Nanoarchaeales archaeon]|nr:hypothetical protein [Nanoarchaeales archaeon]